MRSDDLLMMLSSTRKLLIFYAAIGATPKEVRKVFIAEAALIGLIGGVLGAGIGIIVGVLPYLLGGTVSLIDLILPSIFVFFITIAISVLISIVATVYPAKRASKMNPVEAFAYDW